MAGTEKSLRGQVFDKIRSDILNGKYKRGEELVESSIGKELGISRTPVREAIRQLELEGLVQLVPNKGAFVTGISENGRKRYLSDSCTLRRSCCKNGSKEHYTGAFRCDGRDGCLIRIPCEKEHYEQVVRWTVNFINFI
mgnify:CR=1 FL=1